MSYVAKPLGVSLGFDTSEDLTLAHYQFLAGKGFQWGCRYVPLSSGVPTIPKMFMGKSLSHVKRTGLGTVGSPLGIIQKNELDAALSCKLGMMFVQYARSSGWSQTVGLADGEMAAQHVLALGVPNTVSLWADMDVAPNEQIVIDYLNAWYEGTVKGGMDSRAAGNYMEPGVPMNPDDRYKKINMHRYWACQSNDPNRFVSHRGNQIIQAFGGPQGEYSPEPGLLIDGDFAQFDFFSETPIAVFSV
jgi:Domain of unknown function (DUF1906)